MSNHEPKLLRYLRGHQIQTSPLIKTIEQCGEDFLRDPCLLKWLESLPWIVRYTDTSYLFTPAYVRIDPSIDSTKIIVSIVGYGILRQRESLMKLRSVVV
jgi:hypothetical protein